MDARERIEGSYAELFPKDFGERLKRLTEIVGLSWDPYQVRSRRPGQRRLSVREMLPWLGTFAVRYGARIIRQAEDFRLAHHSRTCAAHST